MAPDSLRLSIYTDGWTGGVVYSFIGAETITFSTAGDTAVIADYSTVAGALAGDEDGASSDSDMVRWTRIPSCQQRHGGRWKLTGCPAQRRLAHF